MALNFLVTFFSRRCLRSSSVYAIYVALSSLTLHLRQRIRPFTTNKGPLGPPLDRDRDPLAQWSPPVGGIREWSAPALNAPTYKFNNYFSRDIFRPLASIFQCFGQICTAPAQKLLHSRFGKSCVPIRFSNPAFLLQSNNLAIR